MCELQANSVGLLLEGPFNHALCLPTHLFVLSLSAACLLSLPMMSVRPTCTCTPHNALARPTHQCTYKHTRTHAHPPNTHPHTHHHIRVRLARFTLRMRSRTTETSTPCTGVGVVGVETVWVESVCVGVGVRIVWGHVFVGMCVDSMNVWACVWRACGSVWSCM